VVRYEWRNWVVTTPNLTEPLPIGTRVKIRGSGYGVARIVEFRGPLGPKGAPGKV
jgi:hypothetical protein